MHGGFFRGTVTFLCVAVVGCQSVGRSSDVSERTRSLTQSQCASEWQGDSELAGNEEINAACTRACRSHAREDFAAAAASCQSVFRLTQRSSNFGTYAQCRVCFTSYPDFIEVGHFRAEGIKRNDLFGEK